MLTPLSLILKTRVIMKKNNRRKPYRYFFVLIFTLHCLLSSVSFADEIHSRSVVVMDPSTEEIVYAKNPYLKRPPASTTKLMTAIVVVENANLSDMVTISRKASRVSPHKAGFREGDRVTVEQLLYAALLDSANDAAVALSEEVAGSEKRFVTLMNREAMAIGAVSTRFTNASGLPDPGQYTTGYDLAKIMNYALRHEKLKEIIGTRVAKITTGNGKSMFLRNTNRLLWSEEDLVGGKTGYTRKAMHCLVCAAERGNEKVIVAILGSPSRDVLWKESGILISKGFDGLGNRGRTVVHITKTHPGAADIRVVSGEKNMGIRAQNLKFGKNKKVVAQKTTKKKTKIFAKKKAKTKVLVKKKGKTLAKGKHKGKKDFSIAEQSGPDLNKG